MPKRMPVTKAALERAILVHSAASLALCYREPMCNLYSMTRNREAILRLFRVSGNRAAAIEPQDAIFPGYQAPIVRKAADGERELVVLNWGFVLLQKDYSER
jgi:hypothetical protein